MIRGLLVATIVVTAACSSGHAEDKRDFAARTAKKLAWEAYPEWLAAHPDRECPAKLADVVGRADIATTDPWGHPYKMMCGKRNLPHGAKGGLAVLSLGEDGQEGTADDIKSWE